MAKITAVIIDDEAPARDVIKTYLKEHPEIEVVAECSNGFEGLKAVQDLKPDMVFSRHPDTENNWLRNARVDGGPTGHRLRDRV